MNESQYIGLIRRLRDDYSDEIPFQIVHSTDDKKYKCRKGWFQSVYCGIVLAEKLGFVDKNLVEIFNGFFDYARKTNLIHRLTTREDIERANSLLTKIIDSMSDLKPVA